MPSTATSRLEGTTTSVAVKAPCRVATTAAIVLSGLQTIDGVALAARDRVLVKDQTSATQNGIWLAQSGAWTRALDFNGSLDAVDGTQTMVREGAVNANTYWRCSATDPLVIGTGAISFARALINDASTISYLSSADGTAIDLQTLLRLNVVQIESRGGGTDKTGAQNLAAFMSAITLLSIVGGGIIKLGVGTYNVAKTSAHLSLPSNVEIVGSGKATRLVRSDSNSPPGYFFRMSNTTGNAFRNMTVVGNDIATGFGNGALFYYEFTAAAAAACVAPVFENLYLENCKSDGWIGVYFSGNPSYDLTGPKVHNCTFTGGSSRGPSDLGIPGGCINIWGNMTEGSTSRIRNIQILNCYADVPKVKSAVFLWGGIDGAVIDNFVVDRIGTEEIADDCAGYAFVYGNEDVGAPNPTNIVFRNCRVEHGKSAGIYSAAWGGYGGRIVTQNCRINGITDTQNGTRPKGGFAFTDSNTTITIDNVIATQSVCAIDVPMAAGGSITIDGVQFYNYKASVTVYTDPFTTPTHPVGNGSLTLDYTNPVLSGYSVGDYRVQVTSGGGTGTPTFTVYDPSGATVGTYTIGGAAFADEIGFTISTGTTNFATGDAFIVTVYAEQPAANMFGIRLGKQPDIWDRGASGTIQLRNVTIRNQGTGCKGIVVPSTDGNGALLTYGPIEFSGNFDIETMGVGIQFWGAAEDPIGPLLSPFGSGVYLNGSYRVISVSGQRSLLIRATSNYIEMGCDFVSWRSPNTASAAAPQIDLRGCQNINITGTITCNDQGGHASDDPAWDATDWQLTSGPDTYTSTKGTIKVGSVVFQNCASGYRTAANSLGTTGATYNWTPTMYLASVANIDPVTTDWERQVYITGSWQAMGTYP